MLSPPAASSSVGATVRVSGRGRMLRDSCFRNTGDARRPPAAFDREGGGRETRARGVTGAPAGPEVPRAEGLQATSEQPVQEGQPRPEGQVGGPSEIAVPLGHGIVAEEALWGLVEEEVEVAAAEEDAPGEEGHDQRKKGEEDEEQEPGKEKVQVHEEEEDLKDEGEQQEQKSRRRRRRRKRGRGSRSKRLEGGGGEAEAQAEGGRAEGGGVGGNERGGAGAPGYTSRGGGGGGPGGSGRGRGPGGGAGGGREGVGAIKGRAELQTEEEEEQQKGEEEVEGKEDKEERGEEEQKPSEQGGRRVEEAQQLQVKQDKKKQFETGLRPCPSPLEALEALQIELQPVNKQASREHARLKLRMWQRRRHHLEQRSALIQGIRGFWAKAVSFLLLVEGPEGAGLAQGEGKGGDM